MADDVDPRHSSSSAAYGRIKARIRAGEYAPGERLPEATLSRELELSRTPVRDALVRLAQEGLVEMIPNRGAFVPRWTPAHVEEIFDIRLALEPRAARLAVATVTADELRELDGLCDRMDDALRRGRAGEEYVAECTRLNAEFHRIIIDSAGNQLLRSLLTPAIEFPLMHRTIASFSFDRLANAWNEHREILEGLRSGDAELAGTMMSTHIFAARDLLRHDPPGDARSGSGADG